MTLLVFGATGQLGRALIRADGDRVLALPRSRADLRDPGACVALLQALARQHPLTAVINAAAWTDVDGAEADPATAHLVNATAPGALARAAADLALPFVQVSTDHVLPGLGTAPQDVTTPPAPANAYGRSKWAGEQAVRAASGPHAILRCSWVIASGPSGFIPAILGAKGPLRVVGDQWGAPTPATDLARACVTIADRLVQAPDLSGSYHFAGTPDVSRAGFARAILRAAGRDTPVTEIASSDWPGPAPRPRNGRLDCHRTGATFGLNRPEWHPALERILRDLTVAT